MTQAKRRVRRPPPQTVFRPARWKGLLLVIPTGAGEAVGLWMLFGESTSSLAAGLLVTAFFGVGLIALLERLLRPPAVDLTRDAFRIRSRRETTTVAWDDLDALEVVRVGRSYMLAYRLQPAALHRQDSPSQRLTTQANALLTGGFHGGIPGSHLPGDCYDMRDILEWYWRRPKDRRRLPA